MKDPEILCNNEASNFEQHLLSVVLVGEGKLSKKV
jgi:hypothetical protein